MMQIMRVNPARNGWVTVAHAQPTLAYLPVNFAVFIG